jgi:hypothetical protein
MRQSLKPGGPPRRDTPKRMYAALSCSLIVGRRLPQRTAPPAQRRVTLCNPILVTPFFPALTLRRIVPLKNLPAAKKLPISRRRAAFQEVISSFPVGAGLA